MGRHGVNRAQQRESLEPLCGNVTMGEAEVRESSEELSAAFGRGRTEKELVYSPLAYGAGWIQSTCQTLHPGAGQCNKAPLVHMPQQCCSQGISVQKKSRPL